MIWKYIYITVAMHSNYLARHAPIVCLLLFLPCLREAGAPLGAPPEEPGFRGTAGAAVDDLRTTRLGRRLSLGAKGDDPLLSCWRRIRALFASSFQDKDKG